MVTNYTFNGKGLLSLSLVELRDFESATIEKIIINNDNRIMTNQKLVEIPFNSSLLFDKCLIESRIKRDELQLQAIKKQIEVKMSMVWV